MHDASTKLLQLLHRLDRLIFLATGILDDDINNMLGIVFTCEEMVYLKLFR
jgi:hypothetical protein